MKFSRLIVREAAVDALRALIETHRPRILLYLISTCILTGILWAKWAVLDEVTIGTGKVIPSSQVQSIQNLEGGILAALKVREGDVVEKDQVLLQIDDTKFASSYREGRARYLALATANARLQAQATGSRLIFPADVKKDAPNIVRIESALHESQMRALDVSVASLQRSYQLAREELEKTAPLIHKGAVSEVELLRLQRQVNDLRGQIEDKRNKFRADAQTELNKNQADIEGLEETNLSSKDRVERTTVRSPVKGVVKKINVVTIGGVIQSGMNIMDIVPIEENLLIEAQVRPTDIAFLHPGQEAMVKITAYDYSVYGGLRGTLEHISADAITDDRRNDSYFIIRVRTEKNFLERNGQQLPIIPGMTATAEVLTGQKSVLAYLLKPLLKTQEKALRER